MLKVRVLLGWWVSFVDVVFIRLKDGLDDRMKGCQDVLMILLGLLGLYWDLHEGGMLSRSLFPDSIRT